MNTHSYHMSSRVYYIENIIYFHISITYKKYLKRHKFQLLLLGFQSFPLNNINFYLRILFDLGLLKR